NELVSNGFEAAQRMIELMRNTFDRIPPADIVQAFIRHGKSKKGRADALWDEFGEKTIKCMQDWTHLLACLWESAWAVGKGEDTIHSTAALTEEEAMGICADRDFLTSCTISEIGARLKKSNT